MKEIIFTVKESSEGGYEAQALGVSIFTEGDDLKSLYENIKDAVRCHYDEDDCPKVVRVHFLREEVLAV